MTPNGEATVPSGGRFRRFAFAGAGLALLAACTAEQPAPAIGPVVARPASLAAMRPVAAHSLDLGKLKGLSAARLVALFGEPDFRHLDPPAELWQYRGADCVLDLFLYQAPGGARVVYSEAHDRSLGQSGDCTGGGDAVIRHIRETPL